MSAVSAVAVLDRLQPQVRDYRCGHLHVGDELRRMQAVYAVGAREATIFYAARILETLVADALARLQFAPSPNTCSNLFTLEQYDLLPKLTRYGAHGLRVLGNAARHVLRACHDAEAAYAMAFTESVLQWFFVDFPFRDREFEFKKLTIDDDAAAALCPDPTMNDTLRELAQLVRTDRLSLDRVRQALGSTWLHSTTAPAVIADIWLDQGKHEPARAVLVEALARSPQDLRLRQLLTLADSRAGRLDEARAQADELLQADKADDETTGIAAGVYKRLWRKHPQETDPLRKAQRLYRRAWDQSRKSASYPGINAAACSLWNGRPDAARRIAGEVLQLLDERSRLLAQGAAERKVDVPIRGDLWTRVARAEALLLCGEYGPAADEYRAAFDDHRTDAGSCGSSRVQMREILRAMNPPPADEARFADL